MKRTRQLHLSVLAILFAATALASGCCKDPYSYEGEYDDRLSQQDESQPNH